MILSRAEPHDWDIKFSRDPYNVGVTIDTECKDKDGRLIFYAVDFVHVEPEWVEVVTRRQSTPAGIKCTIVAQVIRNEGGSTGDPGKDYVGESSIVVYTEP